MTLGSRTPARRSGHSPSTARPALAAVLAAMLASALAAVLVPVLAAPVSAAPPTTPYVSELHYDDAGADSGEFVEVALPPGTTSAGHTVVLYNGSDPAAAVAYDTDPVPVVEAPADAPAVAVVDYPANGLQNGAPDGVALVDGSGTVVDFVSYEGVLTAADGPAAGSTSTDIGVAEAGEAEGASLMRRRDTRTGELVWQGPGPATPGLPNPDVTTPAPPADGPCDVTAVEVGAVQGPGAATPLEGTTVTVRGVVVADLPAYSGFFLQDADGDGDAATSDGVFVHSPGAEVDLGDPVAARGVASDRFGQTQVGAGEDVEVCAGSGGTPPAAPLDLPATEEERERLEGMLVEVVDTLTVSEVYDLTRFGELTLSEGGVLVQPTEVAAYDTPEAAAVAAGNAARRLVLDDGSDAGRSLTDRPYLGPSSPVRVGDRVALAEPTVLGYGYGAWRLQPADGTADGMLLPQDTRPPAPAPVGGDLQVAAFNVLNYFVTHGGEGRGAATAEAFELQAAKTVAAIRALRAEVVTLMEIEDTDSTGYSPGDADRALADLVARLNAAAGAGTWAYVPLPDELYAVDRDVIRNGIIYRPAAVTPVGEPVGLVDETVWANAREPLAQTFTARGDRFTVVANHFKSKSGSGATGDNVDQGQGPYNADRVRQATSLAAFAASLRASTGDDDVLLLGDLNAYTHEDPVEALREAGFTDLGERLDPGRYSYVFQSLSGSLDHALATASLTAKVTDLTHWGINAVESPAYQYDGDLSLYAPDPYRSSDHDPLLLGLDLVAPGPAPRCRGVAATVVGTPRGEVLRGTRGRDVIVAGGGHDVVYAAAGDDLVCAGGGADYVEGGDGRDVLLGQDGPDELRGGEGDDRLFGGPGRDLLRQGPGRGPVVQGPPRR